MRSNHESAKGYVYILTNPSFREDWVKIGKSSRPVNVRSKELDNTAVPLPFEIFATLETVKFHEAETLVHEMIDDLTDLRIRQNREFFNIKPAAALKIFYRIARVIDDAIVVERGKLRDGDGKEGVGGSGKPPRKRGEIFDFYKAGIEKDEIVTFTPTSADVKVISNKKIRYEGHEYSLSGFAKEFMPDVLRTKTNSYHGPKFFTYKGRGLVDVWNDYVKAKKSANPDVDMPRKVDTMAGPSVPETGDRKPPFRFSMVGIKIGETVTFTPTNMDVRVASDKQVEYGGQNYTLTDFARKFIPRDRRNASNAYRGPKYFTYMGRMLDDIRNELQN